MVSREVPGTPVYSTGIAEARKDWELARGPGRQLAGKVWPEGGARCEQGAPRTPIYVLDALALERGLRSRNSAAGSSQGCSPSAGDPTRVRYHRAGLDPLPGFTAGTGALARARGGKPSGLPKPF